MKSKNARKVLATLRRINYFCQLQDLILMRRKFRSISLRFNEIKFKINECQARVKDEVKEGPHENFQILFHFIHCCCCLGVSLTFIKIKEVEEFY